MSLGNTLYDLAFYPFEIWRLAKIRKQIVRSVPGPKILEIGIGTGLNLRHYPERIHITGIEPFYDKLSYSRAKHPALKNISYVQSDAEELPFGCEVFDGIVGTLVFCTIPDPVQAFREMKRVIKPGGYIRILEHVRIPHPLWGKLQDWLTPVWKPVSGGCHLNRETSQIAGKAGLSVKKADSYLGGAILDVIIYPNKHASG